MPNYDLSSADLGRVAGSEVDLLRVANQDVWVKPSDESWTIFDGAEITLQSFSDATNTDGIMNQFHKYVGADLEITDIGIYIPAGSFLIGLSGFVETLFNAGGFLKANGYSTVEAIASRVATDFLVEGWNWTSQPIPLAWTDSEPYVLAGYAIGGYYVYNGSATSNAIGSAAQPSTGANFELTSTDNADFELNRGWFDAGSGTHSFITTSARSYGIDIRARNA